MKIIIFLFAMLGVVTVQGDAPARIPQITLSCNEKTWIIVNTDFPNVRGTPGTMEKLQVILKNNLPERKIFTSYETFLPFIETKDGRRIFFSDKGADHSRLPQANDFISLEPGQTSTLSADMALYKLGSGYGIWYECPSGNCYATGKLPPGIYNLGIRYRLPVNYHQPWDDAQLIWSGSVDSDVITIEIKSS